MESHIVPFYGDEIISIKNEQTGEIFVPLKPIVENLGVSWSGQAAKLKANHKKWGCIHILIPTKSGTQEMICILLTKLNGLLFSINANKVRKDLRSKVEKYQDECFQALYNYWNGGIKQKDIFDDILNTDFDSASLEVIDKLVGAIRNVKTELIDKTRTLEHLFKGNQQRLLTDVLYKLNPKKSNELFREYKLFELLKKDGKALLHKPLPRLEFCNPESKEFGRLEAMTVGIVGARAIIRLLHKDGWTTEEFNMQFKAKGFAIEDIGKTNNIPVLDHPFRKKTRTKQKLLVLKEDKDGDNTFLQQLTSNVQQNKFPSTTR